MTDSQWEPRFRKIIILSNTPSFSNFQTEFALICYIWYVLADLKKTFYPTAICIRMLILFFFISKIFSSRRLFVKRVYLNKRLLINLLHIFLDCNGKLRIINNNYYLIHWLFNSNKWFKTHGPICWILFQISLSFEIRFQKKLELDGYPFSGYTMKILWLSKG